jgi:hypothetical protein
LSIRTICSVNLTFINYTIALKKKKKLRSRNY